MQFLHTRFKTKLCTKCICTISQFSIAAFGTATVSRHNQDKNHKFYIHGCKWTQPIETSQGDKYLLPGTFTPIRSNRQIRQTMYAYRTIVVRSRNHCCSGKATKRSLCVFEADVTQHYKNTEGYMTMPLWRICHWQQKSTHIFMENTRHFFIILVNFGFS